MAFKIIYGTFHVVGYSPDGDSVRFLANESSNWDGLTGSKVRKNAKGHVQLRIEAIDTLETHYENQHQPLEYAKDAMNELMELLGISNIVWNNSQTRIDSANDSTEGYILVKEVEKYGRPVSFVFSGKSENKDGSEVFVDESMIKKSINYQMIEKGLAYPTFYNGLYQDLREVFNKATTVARNGNIGLWKMDRTNNGFDYNALATITDEVVILPKLFRRLIAFIGTGGSVDGFGEYLKTLNEKVLVVKNAHFTHFDNLVTLTGKHIKLIEKPEDLVFYE
jgi:Micrococcal nuclease (thermonuclease) homologs